MIMRLPVLLTVAGHRLHRIGSDGQGCGGRQAGQHQA
jgi:hypothetical protein